MTSNHVVTENTANGCLESPFLNELVRQIRSQDAYGVYKNWSDELVLKPFIIDRKEKRKISIEGAVNPVTKGRIILYFHAIASRIERETGQLAQVVVDLNHEGFGWCLVFCGRLLVVTRTLRDAHRFGFDSLEKLAVEGEKLTQGGIELVKRYHEVARL
ncbi:NifX-associated nitrogen fixation protein [Lyngbya aestuarii]|uniref:NifX-associated nitrogen fixation protein n=1 Tax=Lyngbya aestuarii TaxID=118322 RepID=UPI00403D9EA9